MEGLFQPMPSDHRRSIPGRFLWANSRCLCGMETLAFAHFAFLAVFAMPVHLFPYLDNSRSRLPSKILRHVGCNPSPKMCIFAVSEPCPSVPLHLLHAFHLCKPELKACTPRYMSIPVFAVRCISVVSLAARPVAASHPRVSWQLTPG
jgi:hypothetical protein